MRTSFHHQPEAQHPKSPAIETPVGRLPHLWVIDGLAIQTPDGSLSVVGPVATIRGLGLKGREVPLATEGASSRASTT